MPECQVQSKVVVAGVPLQVWGPQFGQIALKSALMMMMMIQKPSGSELETHKCFLIMLQVKLKFLKNTAVLISHSGIKLRFLCPDGKVWASVR